MPTFFFGVVDSPLGCVALCFGFATTNHTAAPPALLTTSATPSSMRAVRNPIDISEGEGQLCETEEQTVGLNRKLFDSTRWVGENTGKLGDLIENVAKNRRKRNDETQLIPG